VRIFAAEAFRATLRAARDEQGRDPYALANEGKALTAGSPNSDDRIVLEGSLPE
jgi:hypothetical protein